MISRASRHTVYLAASGRFSLAEVMVFPSARLSSPPESCVCIVTPLRGFRLVGFHPGLCLAPPWATHLTPLARLNGSQVNSVGLADSCRRNCVRSKQARGPSSPGSLTRQAGDVVVVSTVGVKTRSPLCQSHSCKGNGSILVCREAAASGPPRRGLARELDLREPGTKAA